MRERRLKRNPLLEGIMASEDRSRIQRNLSHLCAKYRIYPDREKALEAYSDSMAKATLVPTGKTIFGEYKTAHLFDIKKGISLNKEVKRLRESERTKKMILEARAKVQSFLKTGRESKHIDSMLTSLFDRPLPTFEERTRNSSLIRKGSMTIALNEENSINHNITTVKKAKFIRRNQSQILIGSKSRRFNSLTGAQSGISDN